MSTSLYNIGFLHDVSLGPQYCNSKFSLLKSQSVSTQNIVFDFYLHVNCLYLNYSDANLNYKREMSNFIKAHSRLD